MNVIPFGQRSAKSGKKTDGVEAFDMKVPPLPENALAIGIDLGTSHTVVSVYQRDQEKPTTLDYEGSPLIPSVLWVENHEIKVGIQAKESASKDPQNLIQSTKRTMGKPSQGFVSGGRSFTSEEVATEILKYVCNHPVIREQQELCQGIWAVITVPAHFDDAARRATIQAASDAGIQVIRIVNEPTAAALAYSMFEEIDPLGHELLVVYDLGGGTFDVTVVEREGLTFHVLASEGHVELGGDDFDRILSQHLLEFVFPDFARRRLKAIGAHNTAVFSELMALAKAAKCNLSSEGTTKVIHEKLGNTDASINVEISRSEFEELISPLLNTTIKLTQKALQASKKPFHQLARILLVGGSTRVPCVSKMLLEYFNEVDVDARLEPDLAVSWGAALQSALILGMKPGTILVDVCSHSLGIGVAKDPASIKKDYKEVAKQFGIPSSASEEQILSALGPRLEEFNREVQKRLSMVKIIHRNTPIPAKKSEFFSTMYENQLAIQVILVQGENESVGDNRLIGDFMFKLQQPAPIGTRCEIQLTYDANGMIQVRAKQSDTSHYVEAQFDSRSGNVTGWTSVSDSEDLGIGAHQNPMRSSLEPIKIPQQAITNLLLDRSKKHEKKLKEQGMDTSEFRSAIEKYASLLIQAQEEEVDEDAFDLCEQILKDWIRKEKM
jgi:molecular chaperone DnaK